LNLIAVPPKIIFTIKSLEDGDIISGIDFLTQFKFVENINELVDIFNKKNLNLNKKYLKKKSFISSITLFNVHFGFNKNKNIFTNFNYKFFKNKIYAITGKSGTGKSTLADIIGGLISDFSGNLYFNDNKKKPKSKLQ
jgi:ABC-type bacteriocin/lantibiotic exporter with double-glycine peptidase domain